MVTATPPFLHEYVNANPVAVTLKVCVPMPVQVAVGVVGWLVIAGGALTVTDPETLLVKEGEHAPLTTT